MNLFVNVLFYLTILLLCATLDSAAQQPVVSVKVIPGGE